MRHCFAFDSERDPVGQKLRDSDWLPNHISTETRETAMERFKALQQGDNFHALDESLKTTYTDARRTQNTIYWRPKLLRNVERDKANQQKLKEMGCCVFVVWECELKNNKEERLEKLYHEIVQTTNEVK